MNGSLKTHVTYERVNRNEKTRRKCSQREN